MGRHKSKEKDLPRKGGIHRQATVTTLVGPSSTQQGPSWECGRKTFGKRSTSKGRAPVPHPSPYSSSVLAPLCILGAQAEQWQLGYTYYHSTLLCICKESGFLVCP